MVSCQVNKYLGIDRSNAYRSAALLHLPHIHICYDAYHLVSNMNEVLDKIRRFIMENAPYRLEKFLKGKRYILLKGRKNLPLDASQKLRSLYTLNKDLYIAYPLKEQFRQVFQTNDENTATLRLILWIKMCISLKFNEIINGIRYKINSAKIEASNAMIKRIQSKACGIFDVESDLLSQTSKTDRNSDELLPANLKQTHKIEKKWIDRPHCIML